MTREITQIPNKSASMNARGLEGLDMANILAFGIKNNENAGDIWHKEEENPLGYHWHASQLGGCPRDAILKRAGLAIDGITLAAGLTFQIGHLYHSLFEKGAEDYTSTQPLFKVIAMEQGGYHPKMPLAARCDILFSWDGEYILGDYKTESPFAKAPRVAEAKLKGYEYPYKWEHQIQLTATAMVLESNYIAPREITQGRLIYIDKSGGGIDQVPCPIRPIDRLVVTAMVEELEQHWRNYERDGSLPSALKAKGDTWRCQPRSDTDPKGKWCPSRSTCFAKQAQNQ